MNDIPNYQKLLGPVLQFYADEKEHELHEAVGYITDALGLTAEQKAQRTSSGQLVVHNRVSWTHTYLRHAGLIQNVRRGVCVITNVGKRVLQDTGGAFDNSYLLQFEGFREFKSVKRNTATSFETSEESEEEKTPEERITSAIQEHDQALADELLHELRAVDPGYFEKIVGDLLDVMGYGDVTVTRRTNDGGIDAIVDEDALGLSKIYVQAKRYAADNRVNGKEIRDFVGAMDINGVSKGVFITTSFFHSKALDDLRRTQKSVVLVDGSRLSSLMMEYNLGVTTEQTFNLKRLDSDYLAGE